ncbi:MAG: HAMP domain-containing histidine kinase [Bacilli bacterium]|nr:HAMP domain-containing histidine kinase [Bacilli bacterium]
MDIVGMTNKKKNNHFLVIIFIIYFILVIAGMIFLGQLSSIHDSSQRNYENKIKTEINNILNNNQSNTGNIKKELTSLYDNNRLELYLKNDREVIFNSLKVNDINELKGLVNKNVISYQSKYTQIINNEKYEIWINIYFKDLQSVYDGTVIILSIIIVVFNFLILVSIYLTYLNTVNPLKALSKNINALSHFQFKDVYTQQDYDNYNALSLEIKQFAYRIDQAINDIEKEYLDNKKALIKKDIDSNIKNNMIKALIHDLKTPLMILMFNIERLKLSDNDEEIKNSLAIVEHLPTKINEILNIINKEGFDIANTNFNIVKYLNTLIKVYYPLFIEKDVDFNLESPDEILYYGNKEIIKQIFNNTLSNALKYLSNGNVININISNEKHNIIIQILNSSAYISLEQQEHIFDMIRYREDVEGSGYGLFLTKNLLAYLKGEITFSYQNNQAKFKITIPNN